MCQSTVAQSMEITNGHWQTPVKWASVQPQCMSETVVGIAVIMGLRYLHTL